MNQPQTATGHGIAAAEEPTAVSEEQFLINHLTQRCAELVSEYEQKLAIGALQFQVCTQQYDRASARVVELEAVVASLQEQLPKDADQGDGAEELVRDDRPDD